MSGAGRRRLLALVILAASVGVLAPLLMRGPAGLASAEPGDGAVLGTAPRVVRLTFAAGLDPAATHMSVTDAAGARVDAGTLVVDGRSVRQPVAIDGGGAYRVQYHATLAGGDQVSGTLSFRVGAGPVGGQADAATHHHGVDRMDPLTVVVLAANAVALGVIGWKLVRRRRGTPTTLSDEPAAERIGDRRS